MTASESDRKRDGFPPIAQLMPHRDPMVLLDRMTEWAPGFAECAFEVRSGDRFVEDGALSVPLLIEHMAQSVAACLGYEAYRGGEGVRVGMIVSCREFKVLAEDAAVGETILLRAHRERGNDSLSHFHCEAHRPETSGRASELIAKATLTLYHGETLFSEGEAALA